MIGLIIYLIGCVAAFFLARKLMRRDHASFDEKGWDYFFMLLTFTIFSFGGLISAAICLLCTSVSDIDSKLPNWLSKWL